MPTTLPPWLQTLARLVGVGILAVQALGHFLWDRQPNVWLLVFAAGMVGILTPDRLERFLPGASEPPPAPPAPAPPELPPGPTSSGGGGATPTEPGSSPEAMA